MRSGRYSTTRRSSSRAWSAMARPKRDRWRPRGIRTSFSTPQPTGRFCRSCILTAIRSPIPRCWRASRARSWSNCCAATAGRRISSRVTSPMAMHAAMAATLDRVVEQIRAIQQDARVSGNTERPRWPMIVLASPKGWTGPKFIDGRPNEGTFRSHQVPLTDPATNPAHLKQLEEWLRSYRPQELFDGQGRLKTELKALAPKGDRRMGANPHANGGRLLRDLRAAGFHRLCASMWPSPALQGSATPMCWGDFCATWPSMNAEQRNFRIFGPDETLSNGLEAVFRGHESSMGGSHRGKRRVSRPHRPGDGNAERTPMRGMARGLPAHGPARPVQLLRGIHPHRRFDVQSAREVAEGDRGAAVARARSLRSITC